MRMKKEIQEPYVNLTISTLKKHGYDFTVMDALDAKEEANRIHELTNITFSEKGPITLTEKGCFASHFLAWRMSMDLSRPVISLEADTQAIRKFDIDPQVYKDYDILHVHAHK